MRRIFVISTALIALSSAALAQSAGDQTAPRTGSDTGVTNGAQQNSKGMSEGRASTSDKSGPAGETVPNGNVGGKEKSGANGS
jgi:hypothetical protein